MVEYKNKFFSFLLFVSFLLTTAVEANTCKPWAAMAISIQGTAEQRVASNDQESWQPIQLGNTFCSKDVLRVRENSRVALILSNDTVVRLDENTTITFSNVSPDSASSLDLKEGIAHFISRVKQAFKVITPFVNASIEGTEFVVTVEPDQAQVTVFEGVVKAENEQGHVVLKQGQTAIALKDQAPVLKILVKPRDAVQWALHYPIIIDSNTIDAQLSEDVRTRLEQSQALYAEGDATGALNIIEDFPDTIPLAAIYTFRAALRLSVGRVEKAKIDIERALVIQNNDSNALALKSIIAVVQNRIEDAESLAQQAIASDAANASAYLALSYAKQAQFDLAGAQTAMDKAPATALVHSRRGELYLMEGDLDKALHHANRAVELNPQLSHTQTVLGFARLIQINIEDAKAAFNKAIKLDQTNPLAHMGLGLAIIRQGKLANGRREIEYAASLDPNNALIRSYLGKAYYEEKRNKVAADQFDMAKALDPNDPTPWFYDAIRKQSENDPVGALKDLQKSIALNDNRAVYRSRFLLDQDNASRNANLGGIYQDLGFEQLAVQQGIKSINKNPLNYSAHRLLADTYTIVPRHEFSRVNEYFIAQLLQPASQHPITPEKTEMTIGVFEGDNPADLSQNEYSSLFERNGDKLDINFSLGGNNSAGHAVNFSSLENNTSVSISHYFYKSDGFRDNNHRSQEIFTQNIRSDITQNTSILFEARSSKTERGDIDLRASEDFSEDLHQSEDIKTLRLGLKQNFGKKSVLLASVARQDADLYTLLFPDPAILTFDTEALLDIADLRYVYTESTFNLSIGTVQRRYHGTDIVNDFGFLFPSDFDTRYRNIYAYTNIPVKDNFTVILGGSRDSLDDALVSKDKDVFNSKFGLVWEPLTATTVRLAYFETLQRPRVSFYSIDPTLEPTQIAGFNQFLFSSATSVEGQESENYGFALEHSFSPLTHMGIEAIKREINPPIQSFATMTPQTLEPDWTEKLVRLYFYKIINKSTSLTTEYILEEFDHGDDSSILGSESFFNLTTKKLPISLNYFANKQFSASLKATRVEQEGYHFIFPDKTNIEDSFWVYDANVNYNLKNNEGIIQLSVINITDEEFAYQDTNPSAPVILPDRFVSVKIKLTLD